MFQDPTEVQPVSEKRATGHSVEQECGPAQPCLELSAGRWLRPAADGLGTQLVHQLTALLNCSRLIPTTCQVGSKCPQFIISNPSTDIL